MFAPCNVTRYICANNNHYVMLKSKSIFFWQKIFYDKEFYKQEAEVFL